MSAEKHRKRRNLVAFRAPLGVEAALIERALAGRLEKQHVAERDLRRYYAALAAELVAVELSQYEALLIIYALNGVMAAEPPEMASMLALDIAEAITVDRLAEQWGIDGPALMAKLGALTFSQCLALIDATERFWLYNGELDHEEALRRVGLLRPIEGQEV